MYKVRLLFKESSQFGIQIKQNKSDENERDIFLSPISVLDKKPELVGRMSASWYDENILSFDFKDPIIILTNESMNIGKIQMPDFTNSTDKDIKQHLKSLKKNKSVKLEIKLEQISHCLQDTELSMMMTTKNFLNDLVIDYVCQKMTKDK